MFNKIQSGGVGKKTAGIWLIEGDIKFLGREGIKMGKLGDVDDRSACGKPVRCFDWIRYHFCDHLVQHSLALYYAHVANKDFDRLTKELIDELHL